MELRQIGTSTLKASVVGIGCNNFGPRLDKEGSRRVIDRAIERGINFFDTADTYGKGTSETILGEVLGSRRKDIVLASKFGWQMDDSGQRQGASRRYIMTAVEDSLSRLKTDWIDLYQLHRPDPATPIEETLRALDELVRQGKVRFIGCSNFSADQVVAAETAAQSAGTSAFVSCQNHYNLLTRGLERDVAPALGRFGMSLIPFAPLAAGLLTGKFRRNAPMPEGTRIANTPRIADRYLNDANWRIIEALTALSAQRGHSLLDLAMAWVAARDPVCSVIAGAMSPGQVDANVAALSWRLSAGELAEIDKITGMPT
jgi:aryl-alcohol dehydrogenase-like predicted oxidoreductase